MGSNNISTQALEKCCGCKACGDVCPKNAISYRTDLEGFFYPSVNNDCIDCGLCRKVCPELNLNKINDNYYKKFFGCLDKNRERRDSGSSGGIFGLLAETLLHEGYKICGAAFNNQMQLQHQFAVDPSELKRLKKSKYLQSNCGHIYKTIKENLRVGQKVMFVGTPCQCNAMKNVVGPSDNLILVDFACHGVPSQELFDKCISYYERSHRCKVISYTFRFKPKYYGSPQNFLLSFDNGKKISTRIGYYYEEPFYYGFQKYITLRPSCYACPWATSNRVSDITLADFWGIENVTKKWDRTNHPSLVIINTQKGKNLFESIKENIDWLEVSEKDAVQSNRSLVAPTVLPPERARFFADYSSIPFNEVVNKYLTMKGKWKKNFYYAIPFPFRKIMLNFLKSLHYVRFNAP